MANDCKGLVKSGAKKGKLKKGYKFKKGRKCPTKIQAMRRKAASRSSGLGIFESDGNPGVGRVVAHTISGAALGYWSWGLAAGEETPAKTEEKVLGAVMGGAGGYLWATRKGGWWSQHS